MKPEFLRLENIGPFVGKHVIDFTKLDKIFLISGKTGSGKTTILDAITYALYGKLPGARGKYESKQFRSDFCKASDLSKVELEFSLNNEKYRIIRILPLERVTRNNTLTLDLEKVEFYKKNKTEEWILQENKTAATNLAIQTLLGLSIAEFSKIVLLPQGEFSDFLRANSTERKPILEKLFPIEKYSEISARIKDKLNSTQRDYTNLTNQISELEDQTAKTDKATLIEQKNKLTEKIVQIDSSLESLTKEETLLQAQLEQFTAYELLQKQIDNLCEKENSIQHKKEALETAKAASEIRAELVELQNSRIELNNAKHELENCKQEHSDTEKLLNQLLNKKELFTTKKDEIEQLKKEAENLEKALKLNVELEKAQNEEQKITQNCRAYKKTNKETQAQINLIEKEITHAKEAANKKNEMQEEEKKAADKYSNAFWIQEFYKFQIAQDLAKDAFTQQKELTDALEKELDDIQKQKKDAEFANTAATLAITLKDSTPCPVCGSIEHPSPAENISLSKDLNSYITNQELLLKNANESLSKRKDEWTKTKTNLEYHITQKPSEKTAIPLKNQNIPSSELLDKAIENCTKEEQNLATIKTHILELEKIAAKRDSIETQLQILQNKLSKMNDDYAKEQTKQALAQQTTNTLSQNLLNLLSDKKTDMSQFDFSSALETATNTIDHLQTEIETYDTELQTTKTTKTRVETLLATTKTAMATTKNRFNIAQEAFQTAVNRANEQGKVYFLDEEQVQKSIIDSAEQQKLEAEIIDFTTKKADLNSRANEKKTLISTLSKDELQHKFNHIVAELQNTKKQKIESQDIYTNIKSNLDRIDENYSLLQKLRKERTLVGNTLNTQEQLFSAISGKNQKSIPLDAWILGLYLDQITQFASTRLQRISDGRYTLKMYSSTEKSRALKGLDLEICDAHTGKSRMCNTLSGGETFMASISLALAISDTVQSRRGGIQIDSLFIDEGFGSLDDASLEKALSILEEIRETRSIGLISHVGELHNKIPSEIEVTKTAVGSTITVKS